MTFVPIQSSSCLVRLLTEVYSLNEHFRTVQRFLLMADGPVMHHFCCDIFQRVSHSSNLLYIYYFVHTITSSTCMYIIHCKYRSVNYDFFPQYWVCLQVPHHVIIMWHYLDPGGWRVGGCRVPEHCSAWGTSGTVCWLSRPGTKASTMRMMCIRSRKNYVFWIIVLMLQFVLW